MVSLRRRFLKKISPEELLEFILDSKVIANIPLKYLEEDPNNFDYKELQEYDEWLQDTKDKLKHFSEKWDYLIFLAQKLDRT